MPTLMVPLLIAVLPLCAEPDPTGSIHASSVIASADTTPAAQQPPTPPPEIALPPRDEEPTSAPNRLTFFAVAASAFDTNINRDSENLDSYGGTLGIGGIFRNDSRRPTFELQFQSGFHRYARTDRWNRISYSARAAWDRRLGRRLAWQAVGEASIKGSTEDRELSNSVAVAPRLEFRFTSGLRLRASGAWRVRRYDDTPDRNAFNRYGGLELVGRPRSGARWGAGGRYELNAAESARQRYLRWTWFGELSVPVAPRDRLELTLHFRRQHYPYRLVDVSHGPDVPRRDRRLESQISWLHSIATDLDVHIGYGFDVRRSNDARRDYRSHQLVLSMQRRW